jgi:transposase
MSESKRQEWAARLRRFQQNPSSVEAFCRAEGVSSASFYLWKRRLAVEPTTSTTPTFVPITVADTPTSPPVEIAFPNGIVIRLPADAHSLRTLFALAREASC